MSETIETAPAAATTAQPAENNGARKSGGGLSGMLLPELKQIAGGLGIKTSGMKKADLVSAIKAAQGGGQAKTKKDDAPKGTESTSSEQAKPAAKSGESTPREASRGDSSAKGDSPNPDNRKDSSEKKNSEGQGQQGRQGGRDQDNQGQERRNKQQNQGDQQGKIGRAHV